MSYAPTITRDEPEWADPNYYQKCRVCGAAVAWWELHKAWHEKHGDAIDQPAGDAAE